MLKLFSVSVPCSVIVFLLHERKLSCVSASLAGFLFPFYNILLNPPQNIMYLLHCDPSQHNESSGCPPPLIGARVPILDPKAFVGPPRGFFLGTAETSLWESSFAHGDLVSSEKCHWPVVAQRDCYMLPRELSQSGPFSYFSFILERLGTYVRLL